MKSLSLTLATVALVYGSLVVQGQKYPAAKVTIISNEDSQQQRPQQQQQQDLIGENGERVDKLASAAGDLYWQQQPQQLADWYRQTLNKLEQQQQQQVESEPETGSEMFILQAQPGLRLSPSSAWDRVEKRPLNLDSVQSYLVSGGASGPAAPRNYHALVDDYKHWASRTMSSNPMREGRAFRPRLMSTARGFGKRSIGVAAGINSNFNGPNIEATGRDGKMSPAAISTKYSQWSGQEMARWPTIDKYINTKYADYNGDGLISAEEKYQSL